MVGTVLHIINSLCLSVAGAHKIGYNLKGGSVSSQTCTSTPYPLGKAQSWLFSQKMHMRTQWRSYIIGRKLNTVGMYISCLYNCHPASPALWPRPNSLPLTAPSDTFKLWWTSTLHRISYPQWPSKGWDDTTQKHRILYTVQTTVTSGKQGIGIAGKITLPTFSSPDT